MPFGFYIIMAAQFFSSLADNALLVAAIAVLIHMTAPEWMTPLLKFFFTVSYVAFAAFVGAFADSMPKGRVMFVTNLVKISGCLLMFFAAWLAEPGTAAYLPVVLAYGVVGLGAAAYSPAKYGILTEYLPHQKLVVANGWIEGLTVASIILGTLLGGVLVSETVSSRLLAIDVDAFWDLINASHEIAINLLYILSRRVRSGNTTIGEREERATVDALTGLRNRRWLDEAFARELARADGAGRALCLAMVDVDRFKKFNDEHGHRAGDEVLKGVGRVLRDTSRPNDMAARYGGEEFSVLFPDTPLDDALAAAERLRRAIAACEILHEGAALPRVTASFGLVQRLPGESLEQLVARADAALYRAKEQGRDRVCS